MRKLVLISMFLFLSMSILSSQNLLSVNAQDYDLVIYAYESLLADPGYDFIEGFSNYSGVPVEDINLVLLDDANTVVTQAVLEKDNPNADVLIGIDNILIHTAKQEEILEPYTPTTLVNISSNLVTNLDPEKYVVPYDYGIIALWYDCSRINETSNPELSTLTLQEIIDYNLDELLIVEDPTLSSPGLGFLLWTIAVFGDPIINFDGLLGQDWRGWWRNTSDDLRIAASWGAAFDLYATEEENRPIMVSYGTSPSYDVCHPLWGVGYGSTPPSKAIVSHEQDLDNAWLQIEGIGLIKNAPHEETAKQFIDWFLSADLQDHIAMNNWMYPANVHANISTCFAETSINPEEVDILNDLLQPSIIEENLDMWKSDWEAEIAPFSSIFSIILSLIFAATSYSLIKHRNRKK